MRNKTSINCSSCNSIFYKWNYELLKIKNPEKYICKQCKTKNCKEFRECPICKKNFSCFSREKKMTCSYACSNKKFRTGRNNGNWNENRYKTTCFLHHKKECIICGESKIVEVHHYNKNHKDNRPENLVPLCPTHHQYVHSRFFVEIEEKIHKYVRQFLNRE